MKQALLLYVLFATALCSCNSANDYLQKASTEIDQKNYREAIRLLNKALIKNKNLSEAYTQKGYCYSLLDNDDSAIIVYKQLLSFHPKNTLALYNLGLCKYRLEKYEEAIESFNLAMISKGYNPEDTTRFQYIFELSPTMKKLTGQEQEFDVSFSEIFYWSGLAHYSAGHIKKAYGYFRNCISREYNLGESHYMIALCWLANDKKDDACESFRIATVYGYSQANEQIDKFCK
jgi:tetratricopeptide (TPR) repeat protein